MYTQARLWILLAGVAVFLGPRAEGLRGSALVAELKAKAKAALLNPTETVEEVVTVEGDPAGNTTASSNTTVTKTKSLLTGNPQKDYIYDPNLPRELNGYNLSSYPFYNGVPDDIDFKCDDLHDGFYASVPHKCQVYHHCLFGTRYDFLCANYTAFDQKTFICHFVSEVDCNNSPKYFQRNEALYKAASTSPPIVLSTTTTTTTTAPPAPTAAAQRPRRRRPYRRRRPVYEYYYDDQYDDEEYYDDDPPPPRRKNNRKHRPQGAHNDDEDDYYEGGRRETSRSSSSRSDNSRGDGGGETSKETKPTVRVSGPAAGTVYDRPRVPPKIRRPVPIHERDKYDYTAKSTEAGPVPTDNPKKTAKPQNKQEQEEDEEYYDYEYEDDYVKPPMKRGKGGSDVSSDSNEKSSSRRQNGRHRPRQHSRRRPERYDDDYEDERPARPRKRQRHEEPSQMGRGNRGGYRGYSREEPDPVPAERPGFISTGRFYSGNRKRNEDDRSQSSSKKSYTTPVYDDEEEEEEYYDDEEGEVRDDEVNRRAHKPTDSSKGRHSEDYDNDNFRKSNRKPTENINSKVSSKSNTNTQPPPKHDDSSKYENNKSAKRQKPDFSSSTRDRQDSNCKRRSCEVDYSDYSTESSSEDKLKRGDSHNLNNEKEIQNSANERERLFSSRFRDSLSESKPKQQVSDPTGPGRPPAHHNSRGGSQNPEPQQRFKPTLRSNQNSNDYFQQEQTTPTNGALSTDSSDEIVTNKYSNFRSKGRIIPPTPLLDNYKPVQSTENPPEIPSYNQESEPELNSDTSFNSNPDRSVSPRPFSGVPGPRRPLKPVTETAPLDIIQASEKSPLIGYNYRQAYPVNEDNEKPVKNLGSSAQNYRRVKVDPSQFETEDGNQPKESNTNVGNNFRRPNKPVEDIKTESYAKRVKEDMNRPEENTRQEDKLPLADKAQLGGTGYGGTYRRVKISAIPSSAPEPESSTTSNEAPQSLQGTQNLNPVNNYKRPFLVARPLSNYPVVVEDSTKNSLSVNGPFRRPVKQKILGEEAVSPLDDYNTPSSTGIGESYHKVEPGTSINVRPALGYFLPKRAKVRIEENSQRDLEQYPKQLTLNQEEQFSKQSPKVDITAPGPSAPDADIATVKSIYKNDYNGAPPGFTLDIPEEEYDVTLNDALQPSTLHPTRSLVDYQQARLKTRDYQTNIGRTPEYRGRVSYLLPAASQQYISRVQGVYATEKQQENPITARYTSNKGNKKAVSLDQEEYEAVVLTAPADQWPNQRRNRPTEWYW